MPRRSIVRLHLLQELSGERAVSEAELERTLGTLRFLKGLQSARARAAAALEPGSTTEQPNEQSAPWLLSQIAGDL